MMLTPCWSVLLAVWLAACGDKGTGSSKPGGVVLDVRFARTAAAKPVAVLRMDRVVATANRGRELVRQQELSYEAGTWKGSLKLPSAIYEIAVEAFKGERVRWRGSTSVELPGGKTVTAVVELASTNRAPVLTAIGGQQVAEGDGLILGLSASDADGDELTYSMAGYPAGASLSGSTFSWTPTDGQAGAYEVTFTVTDGQGGSDQESVTISVSAPSSTNRAPVLAAIDDRQVAERTALTIELDATDADGDELTFSMAGYPAGASLSGSTFVWTPTHEQAGTYEVTFTVTDGQGGSDQESVTISVSAPSSTNRAPVLAAIDDRQVAERTALTIELDATDEDGDGLTFQVENPPSGASLNGSTFSWTPTDGQAGAYEVTFTVTDGQGGIARETIMVTVTEGRFLYWTDQFAGKIQRANLDGSDVQTIVLGLEDPEGIAIDAVGGKVYWTEWGGVKRANLDGSQIERLGTVSGSDIALDVAGGKSYLANWREIIYRTGLGGAPVETLVTDAGASEVIALDLSRGKMYWAGWRGDRIRRANLDGSQVEIIASGVDRVYDLDVDEGEGKIYWGGWDGVVRANLDGTQIEHLFGRSASGIALDVTDGKIFWTEFNTITVANFDGSQTEIIVSEADGLDWPSDIALYP